MLRCSKEAFALCPTAHLRGSREEATFKEGSDCDKFNQAVEKKTQKFGRWIPVTERFPENEVAVLILAERRYCSIEEPCRNAVQIVAKAFHTDGKTNTEDSSYTWELWDTGADYDEEADAYIIPEGWWESVDYGEEFAAVDDFVTHWMPLPKPPGKDVGGNA